MTKNSAIRPISHLSPDCSQNQVDHLTPMKCDGLSLGGQRPGVGLVFVRPSRHTKCQDRELREQDVHFSQSGGCKSRVKVWPQAGFVPGTLLLACRWVPSLCVCTWPFHSVRVGGGQRLGVCQALFLEGHQCYCPRAPPSWPHLTPLISHRPHLQTPCH